MDKSPSKNKINKWVEFLNECGSFINEGTFRIIFDSA